MRNHSMIVDDFFFDPHHVRALIGRQEMKDYKYRDGVTYPGIVELPESVREEIRNNMEMIVGPAYKQVLVFARYSFQDTKPPHWAHSDREIAQNLGLIYLNDNDIQREHGTATLRHKQMKFETHPQTDSEKKALIEDANNFEAWELTHCCQAKFNRLFCLSADLIHAAMGQFGNTRDDARLVISVFFNLEQE